MDNDLSEAALAELRRISEHSPCPADNENFKVLWQKGYVMAGPDKTHITAKGRRFIQLLDEEAKPAS